MNKILIFAGTTEGRRLSEFLSDAGIIHTLCVASEYGTQVLEKNDCLSVHSGKMDAGQMRDFIRENGFHLVVDATHPYAAEVSRNIREAVTDTPAELFCLKREDSVLEENQNMIFVSSHEECAGELLRRYINGGEETKEKILLTIGCRELSKYCIDERLKEKLVVRIIPDGESMACCHDLGIKGKNIIAMQGPFSVSMNEEIIGMYGIGAVVSKQSGTTGGFEEKVKAAKNSGIPIFVIGRKEETGPSFTLEEIKIILAEKLNLEFTDEGKQEKNSRIKSIILAGIGTGSKGNQTTDVVRVVQNADLLFGAERMIRAFADSEAEKVVSYLPEEIINYINRHPQYNRIVVLFSGDSGFYSGAKKMADALKRETESGALCAEVSILPGISAVSCLAARLRINYEDALILSSHGKEIMNLAGKVRYHSGIFLLLSGKEDVKKLGRKLADANLKDVKVTVGCNLSYEDEKILTLSAEECEHFEENGILTAYIENPQPEEKVITPGMENEAFVRENIPMTKEEIREVSLAKLRLTKDSVLYDIGCGTGSISVEAAGLSDDIRVYAMDQKEEAVLLTEKNARKYGLENIRVLQAKAPEGLQNLPKATHAFIGGSGGNLKEIVDVLFRINPKMRVVINAVSLETIGVLKEIMKLPYVKNPNVVLAQFSHSRSISDYNLMSADNPVWICSFEYLNREEV